MSEGGRVADLEEALLGIRGVVLGPFRKREALTVINHIVGEALFGDFSGALVGAERYIDGYRAGCRRAGVSPSTEGKDG